jgi:hypothetical protein
MALNIDELLPPEDKLDKIAEQVETIQRTHGKQFPTSYALSWVLANQVVQRYYGRLGLDAIPLWRDNIGWWQFNLTKATTCQQVPNRNDESQRYIVFDAIAVNWARPQEGCGCEAQYDLNHAIGIRHQRPGVAVEEALAHLRLDNEQEPFNHASCLHGPHAYAYTKLFQVVTDLICQAPEMVGQRELVIDLDRFGNPLEEPQHPLRKLGLAQPGVTREWFGLIHVATHTQLFINIFTGDMLCIESDDTPHILDYPGWNERNEDQLSAYFAGMLHIAI